MGTHIDPSDTGTASYREVFAVREFRTVFVADLFSLIGDEVAAVALAVLLYQSSGSAFLAALGYATAYVPWLLGGPLLSAWAERLPGRTVMIGCDSARAVLIGLASIPGLPLPAIGGLVLLAAFLAPPFDASRSALLPQILTGDRYPVAMSLRDAVHQSAQLIGFAAGGALVVLLGSTGALALDAVTFALSAVVLTVGLRHRPAPVDPAAVPGARPSLLREAWVAWTAIRTDPMLSGSLLLGVTGAAYAIVPEAIAVAYAAGLGHDARGVGLIMAACAAGSVAGGLAIGRLVAPATRIALMYPLALAGTVPLLLIALRPGLGGSLALFALVGACQAYQIVANSLFARNLPPHLRARAFGLAVAGMYGAQSVAILLAGAAAEFAPAPEVIAGTGVIGVVAVLCLYPLTHRTGGPSATAATGA